MPKPPSDDDDVRAAMESCRRRLDRIDELLTQLQRQRDDLDQRIAQFRRQHVECADALTGLAASVIAAAEVRAIVAESFRGNKEPS